MEEKEALIEQEYHTCLFRAPEQSNVLPWPEASLPRALAHSLRGRWRGMGRRTWTARVKM